ncbi:uncharacterized protein LOC134671964 [Cydia fagiglandana]|uniref:uncharacterized protein LOC134671964 n=1 Tax=Cydia fagiglandana TaxID=1458189 RepID=UPI002FEE6349
MAEVCRLGSYNSQRKTVNDQEENVCLLNVLCVFISLVTILADLTTDVLVFVEYCKSGYPYWALTTLIFIVAPNIMINVFSLRWFVIDQKSGIRHWISHGFLVGLLERYIIFMHKVFECKNVDSIKALKLFTQINDLNLLHFLYVFIGTIPQIILQVYGIVTLNENYHTKAFALCASIASVVWGCANYIYGLSWFGSEKFQWTAFFLKLVWHFGMLISRIAGIILFTIIFGIWTLVPLGLHWSAMTFWIVTQKTTFCPNKLEETFYNVIMGLVYCFCYINLREGHTRYRLMMFYTLMVTQNFGSLFLYVLISDSERQKKPWSIATSTCVIAGTIIGMCAMIFYYRYFHSKGPIPWKNDSNDIELNNKVTTAMENKRNNNKGLNYVRSFKSSQKIKVTEETSERKNCAQVQPSDIDNADKKFLLDHWIARSGTPTFTSAPVGDNSIDVSSVEFHTVENTPQTVSKEDNNLYERGRVKTLVKKGKGAQVLDPSELTSKISAFENIESSIDIITASNLNLQKRRGICSSDELRDDLTNENLGVCEMVNGDFIKTSKPEHGSEFSHDTDGSNKKTSSDSIDMDLDLSFSDINSSDINTFNENIVQKLCLSALRNIKVGNQDADIENIQRIALDILKEMYTRKGKNKKVMSCESFPSKQRDLDTPTEILSVHDYENICAVNIAREAWGLRSWNGYSDIENWLHDGSVFRDRRRDTLTSGSSEISSCISQDLKTAILAAPPFPKKAPTYSNVFVKFDPNNQEEYVDSIICQTNDDTFLAKPCMVDTGKDYLEPILEELDDLGDLDPSSKKRLNSESSLVATIDEIRKATIANSPRNLYHNRKDLHWYSPDEDDSCKMECNLKKALWKEPSKFDSSNIMESLPEKENILNDFHDSKFDLHKKGLNCTMTSSSDTSSLEHTVNGRRNARIRQKTNVSNLKTQYKRNSIKPDQTLQDLSNKDIDLLWQLVTDNSMPLSSTEDLASGRLTSSLQSLIQKDTSTSNVDLPPSKMMNMKKNLRSKPRRKFSILREKFEPKLNIHSDEESLFHSSEKISASAESVVVRNRLDTSNENIESIPEDKINNVVSTEANNSEPFRSDLIMSGTMKEKRSLFMKQVLSPPKFNTKLKHKV